MRFSKDTGFHIRVSCFIRSPRKIRLSSSNVSRSIRKLGFQRMSSWRDARSASNQFCGLGQAQALLVGRPCLRRVLIRRQVRNKRFSLSCEKSSIILSRRNMRFRSVISLTILCKLSKNTTAEIMAILRSLSFIFSWNSVSVCV